MVNFYASCGTTIVLRRGHLGSDTLNKKQVLFPFKEGTPVAGSSSILPGK
jgi:hypothetical protein